jgi:hypothetical protein
MTNLRKAAEMALKYFEDAHGLEDAEVEIKEALRQALAQPGQEKTVEVIRKKLT